MLNENPKTIQRSVPDATRLMRQLTVRSPVSIVAFLKEFETQRHGEHRGRGEERRGEERRGLFGSDLRLKSRRILEFLFELFLASAFSVTSVPLCFKVFPGHLMTISERDGRTPFQKKSNVYKNLLTTDKFSCICVVPLSWK